MKLNVNKGFTMVEIITVVAILGLLSAFAIPRLLNLQANSKIAVLEALRGQVLSVSHQVNLQAHLEGLASKRNAIITFNGQQIRTRWGYPRLNQMFSTPGNNRLIDVDASEAEITHNIVKFGTRNNCRIRYLPPTGYGQEPRIQLRTNGC